MEAMGNVITATTNCFQGEPINQADDAITQLNSSRDISSTNSTLPMSGKMENMKVTDFSLKKSVMCMHRSIRCQTRKFKNVPEKILVLVCKYH